MANNDHDHTDKTCLRIEQSPYKTCSLFTNMHCSSPETLEHAFVLAIFVNSVTPWLYMYPSTVGTLEVSCNDKQTGSSTTTAICEFSGTILEPPVVFYEPKKFTQLTTYLVLNHKGNLVEYCRHHSHHAS